MTDRLKSLLMSYTIASNAILMALTIALYSDRSNHTVEHVEIIKEVPVVTEKVVEVPIYIHVPGYLIEEEVIEVEPDGEVAPMKLNRIIGVIYQYDGTKETYYNLPMGGVIDIMRGIGNTDEYWVREDGVKMLGDYVMCAGNLQVYQRGQIVDTSLGKGIICDTGTSLVGKWLDIAVDW